MKNQEVEVSLKRCEDELNQVRSIVNGLGIASNTTPYLTKYAIIRACGCIENAYKTLIADFCSYRAKPQIKSFINLKIRENSSNPSYETICSHLVAFDEKWRDLFKATINVNQRKTELLTSLNSLVSARNSFAHGGNPTSSIDDVLIYFKDSSEIIVILDQCII